MVWVVLVAHRSVVAEMFLLSFELLVDITSRDWQYDQCMDEKQKLQFLSEAKQIWVAKTVASTQQGDVFP